MVHNLVKPHLSPAAFSRLDDPLDTWKIYSMGLPFGHWASISDDGLGTFLVPCR
jgi:hypothetical protein